MRTARLRIVPGGGGVVTWSRGGGGGGGVVTWSQGGGCISILGVYQCKKDIQSNDELLLMIENTFL